MPLEQDAADSEEREKQEKRWKCNFESIRGIKNVHRSTGKFAKSITKN